MAIQNLKTPNSQLWSNSIYDYSTSGKGMEEVGEVTSFGSGVVSHSSKIGIRLYPSGEYVLNGTIQCTSAGSLPFELFTLPTTLHVDAQFVAAEGNASEQLVGNNIHIVAQKDGAVMANVSIAGTEYIKLDGFTIRPNKKIDK